MAVYENHDIVKKLRAAPGQFDDARLRKEAADEIASLRSQLAEKDSRKHDKKTATRKGAAYLFLVMGISLLLSAFVSHYAFAPDSLPGDGFLLVFSAGAMIIALILNRFMAESLYRD